MEEILAFYRQSLRDYKFDKLERKGIKRLIQENYISKEERNVIRSKVFQMAHHEINDQNKYQVLNWLEAASQTLRRWQKNKPYTKVLFSPHDDCPMAIIAQLNRAKKQIDICMFSISDNLISNRLLYLHHSGIKIRIICDDNKIFDMGSDIKMLNEAGVEVKTDNSKHLMHNKFACIDQVTVLTGSYNWTRSAAMHNQENILITNEKKIVELYQKEFNRIWSKFENLSL